MSDVLIIGGDSMIGAALSARLRADGVNVATTTRRRGAGDAYLDLAAPADDWPALPQAPVWIAAAAVARLADCRNDPDGSRAVNVAAVEALARRAAETGAHLIFLSTDKVFDGRRPAYPADAATCPKSEYGRQKAAAEAALAGTLGLSYTIVRFTKVMALDDGLISGWADALCRGEPITPFTDMTMAPVPLADATEALNWAATRRPGGILQLSGPRDIRYADAAGHIADRIGADPGLIRPCSAATAGMHAAETPTFTSLDTTRLEAEAGIRVPDAFEVIDHIIAGRSTMSDRHTDTVTGQDAARSADWPRFAEIDEPLMVGLHVGNGSGSKVFQSFIDGHPQVLMIPAYPLVYFYPHWRRWEMELKDDWSWERIIETFCHQHASVIDSRRIPGHNGMTGLGDTQNQHVALDEAQFRHCLAHLLDGAPISSRTFLLAVHYAFGLCREEDLKQKKVLVYHVHVQGFASDYLVHDFPEMKVIGMVRDQRSNYNGRYYNSTVAVENAKLNRTDAMVYRRRSFLEMSRILYVAEPTIRDAEPSRVRVIRAEDLHHDLERVMRATAAFLEIDFLPLLLESTFGGLLYWGDAIYDMAPTNKFNPKAASDGWQKKLAARDWFVLEGLFFDYLATYGYTPFKYLHDTTANRIKLFFMLLLPSRIEAREWRNYLTPKTFVAFVRASIAEATGAKPLKDYSFNAYYRHRWGVEDLKLWKIRWYRRFLEIARADAEKPSAGPAQRGVALCAQWCYVTVNLGRYCWSALFYPYWIVRRWAITYRAFRRRVEQANVYPPLLK